MKLAIIIGRGWVKSESLTFPFPSTNINHSGSELTRFSLKPSHLTTLNDRSLSPSLHYSCKLFSSPSRSYSITLTTIHSHRNYLWQCFVKTGNIWGKVTHILILNFLNLTTFACHALLIFVPLSMSSSRLAAHCIERQCSPIGTGRAEMH